MDSKKDRRDSGFDGMAWVAQIDFITPGWRGSPAEANWVWFVIFYLADPFPWAFFQSRALSFTYTGGVSDSWPP
jgi:hypothetical protein